MPACRRRAEACARHRWPVAGSRDLQLRAAAALAAVLVAVFAHAHRTNTAQLELWLDGSAPRLSIELSSHDLAIALGLPVALDRPVPQDAFDDAGVAGWLARRVTLQRDATDCVAATARTTPAPDRERLVVRFTCPADAGDWSFRYRLFADVDPAHVATGRAVLADGRIEELLFDRGFDRYRPSAPIGIWARARALFVTGIEHILFGPDHVLFVVLLVIATPGVPALVKTVTAFTLGHSLTLALAWFGVLQLPAAPVEAAIALTIVAVAALALRLRPLAHAWWLAACFGLVHGLGFYGALDPASARETTVVSLAAFNLGVEAGQLLILVPLAWLLARAGSKRQKIARAGSAAILVVALWWTFERISAVAFR